MVVTYIWLEALSTQPSKYDSLKNYDTDPPLSSEMIFPPLHLSESHRFCKYARKYSLKGETAVYGVSL